jgi:dihydrofolate synthase/folylpolyglutamate synthase
VATLCYQALRAAGFRVGVYTSPHLVDVRERMVVDDRPISTAAFAAWAERLRPAIERAGASFFEATTAIAFADMAARGADIAVIEVGLGGRLDCTNVITPLVSAVTHVGLEHTEYLGSTLAEIAREKAGIAKPGVPFVLGETDEGARRVAMDTAGAAGARVVVVPPGALYRGDLSLGGAHQRRNAAVAAAVLAELPAEWRPDNAAIRRGFARATLPGRFDVRGKWLFDVAHNPGGIEVLVRTMAEARLPRPIHAVVGILGDKDWRTMLATLGPAVDALWVTQPPTAPAERRWDLTAVGEWAVGRYGGRAVGRPRRGATALPPYRLTALPDFARALSEAQIGAGTVLVTGSFHTVGDAFARLPGFAPLG